MNVVRSDPVDGQGVEAADGGVHVVRGFTGKAEHEVRADLRRFSASSMALAEGRRVVPQGDAAQGGVVQGLDAKLKPFFFPARRRGGHFSGSRQSGPGSHGNPGEIGQGAENLSIAAGRRRGRRYWKRIADTRGTARPGWTCGSAHASAPLGGGSFRQAEPRAGTCNVAEGAARVGERPVTVG